MAIIFDGPVTPDALTTFVRNVPAPGDFTLSQYLPDRTFDRNSIDFAELTRTNRTARFRTYDGRLHVSERDTSTMKTVKLPPLSSSLSKGELERLQLEFARTGGTNNAAVVNAIYDDAANLTREVQARMELARGDILTDGVFSMMGTADEPAGLVADYGVPAGNLVTPGTLWSTTASSTVLSDLVTWTDAYVALNGFAPGGFVTSRAVSRLMQKNAEVIAAIAGTVQGRTRVNATELADLLDAEGLPTLLGNYDTVVDVDGTSTRVVPDDRVIFVPPNPADLGYTAWGVSATALELVNSTAADLSFEDAPGIVGVVEKAGPPYREFTFVDAVGMPVLANPRLLMVADVK